MRRPRNAYLPEPSFGERWEWYDRPMTPAGDVRQLSTAEGDSGHAVAELWLPNPEFNRGWELRPVYRDAPPVAAKRLGFR